MKHKRKTAAYIAAVLYIACFIASIFGAQTVYAESTADLSEGSDIYNDIDAYLQRCVKNANIPAMSVSIVNKNEVLFSRSYGQCDSCDTPFLLGSVSKSFTAVCIMQLAEQQKLALTDTVSTYLPDSTDGDKMTVGQLLNHTSGLGEHQTLVNYKIVNKQGVHNYANVNYSLLGKIIEAVSGKTYAEYISENLFKPLGLSHTAATFEESMENGLIDGYTDYWGVPIKRKHRYPTCESDWITVPAGNISASVNDLGKYLQMYLNGGCGVISKESIDTMFYGDTVYVEDDVPFWYGYGWAAIKEPLPETVLRHSGLVETGTACIFIIPDRDIAIAIEADVNDYFVTNEMMDRLGWGIVLRLLGDAANEIKENEYFLALLRIDGIMLAVLLSAILPWCLLPSYARRAEGKKKISRIISFVLLHLLLPAFILLIVPIFFSTPLWVAEAFVPDVFITVVLSAALLFACGAVKGIIVCKHKK